MSNYGATTVANTSSTVGTKWRSSRVSIQQKLAVDATYLPFEHLQAYGQVKNNSNQNNTKG